jgi:predicted ATPase
MAQHPFLKSIRPVNLLSFGPNTDEIELRPLNILIGANGSGKSNLIEVIGLLSKLPDKNPWSRVSETGGAGEWVWKGSEFLWLATPKDAGDKPPSLSVTTTAEKVSVFSGRGGDKSLFYSIGLWAGSGAFAVMTERFLEIEDGEDGTLASQNAFDRDESETASHYGGVYSSGMDTRLPTGAQNYQQLTFGTSSTPPNPKFPLGRSVLSMIGNVPDLTTRQPRILGFADSIERFAFYRDWVFGAGFIARNPISAGQPVERLEENASNLAQMLARYQSDFRPTFDRLNELMKKFYEPIRGVEVRVVSTHLQVAILEEGGFAIPAYRLSDGTLRWLALLVILLNPRPAPVTCIEEPELGLHPDMLPTLADLLVDASTRTQLIVTTHSDSLIDAFTETPEVVCVCEKVEGSTVIRRLDKERLKIWLEDYSLGKLWASGEIGGNRW